MGAVTAIFLASKTTLVDAMVLDSPFDKLKNVVMNLMEQHSNLPSLIIRGAVSIIRRTVLEKAKFDIFDVNPINFA